MVDFVSELLNILDLRRLLNEVELQSVNVYENDIARSQLESPRIYIMRSGVSVFFYSNANFYLSRFLVISGKVVRLGHSIETQLQLGAFKIQWQLSRSEWSYF